jgi:hypothetical protein
MAMLAQPPCARVTSSTAFAIVVFVALLCL